MTDKQLRRWKRRVAADVGDGRKLTVLQRTLLEHAALLQQVVEDPEAGPEARLSAIKTLGRCVDRMRARRQRRRCERD